MNEEDLRDCFAMFAMMGLITRGDTWNPRDVWEVADAMMETRKPQEEAGIAAVKPRRKRA